ncbi:MAG: hypothetical protein PHO37_16005, partial [Kiritimatiellae bacterium]|nr:hypothetical protein [Kiritimatiellia bacterium]
MSNRKVLIRTICKVSTAMLLALLAVSAYAKQERPNIVWLTTEDNSANWYKLYDPDGVAMPNVERL